MTNEEKAFKLTPQEFISLYQSNPKPITNEEKAKDILNCKHCMLGEKICFAPNETPCVHYRDIIKMAQWKDEEHAKERQQWIDKACEWIRHNVF